MLDKSIPYYNILMIRRAAPPPEPQLLPVGFAFRAWRAGEEADWAEIEASVGEFETPARALGCFCRDYLPAGPDVLARRVLFIRSADGEAAATATAWWNERAGRRVPSVHWVAVRPALQGRGLGRALIFETVRRMCRLEGSVDFYLHTQTWSYRAVGLYLRAGFRFLSGGTLDGYVNENPQALPLLREKMGEALRPEWL